MIFCIHARPARRVSFCFCLLTLVLFFAGVFAWGDEKSPSHADPEGCGASLAVRTLKSLRKEMNALLAMQGDSVVLSNRGAVAQFHPGSRRLDFNGCTLWLNAPPVFRNGSWELSRPDFETILRPLLSTNRYPASKLHVLLDPGHGGMDGGAVSRGGLLVEKRLVLDIANRTAVHLREQGMEVRLTRERDEFIPLGERAAMIREWKADLFISIHLNSAGNVLASGPETFVLPVNGFPATDEKVASSASSPSLGNANNARNTLLGYSIQQRLPGRNKRCDRGVRRARFQVLVEATCPAILVECGFVSNQEDARRIIRPQGREEIAAAMAEGVMDYARRIPAAPPEVE